MGESITPTIPPLTEKFFENATLRMSASQLQQWVQVEPEFCDGFRLKGMNIQL